jgi:hypothetical protein
VQPDRVLFVGVQLAVYVSHYLFKREMGLGQFIGREEVAANKVVGAIQILVSP